MILGLMIACIILLILLFITMINLSSFRSHYQKLNKGNRDLALDEHILKNKNEIELVKNLQKETIERMDTLDLKLKKSYSKVSLHKYDAFENQGGKLSFILVMLDDDRDGYILHNIHNHDFSYLYAKQVSRGSTTETLTDEEKKILIQTING